MHPRTRYRIYIILLLTVLSVAVAAYNVIPINLYLFSGGIAAGWFALSKSLIEYEELPLSPECETMDTSTERGIQNG